MSVFLFLFPADWVHICLSNHSHVIFWIQLKPVDVAVIDEIQLIGCDARGWAWTRAVLGLPAKEVCSL